MNNEVADILLAARDLISDPEHWTQGTLCRDAHGERIKLTDPNVHSYCAIGAIHAYLRDVPQFHHKVVAVEDALRDALPEEEPGYRLVHRFNDEHTHAEVMELFDTAIRNVKDGI